MRFLTVALLTALLAACGGGDGGVSTPGTSAQPTPADVTQPFGADGTDTAQAPAVEAAPDCSLAAQRTVIRGYMESNYLWYPQLAAGDPAAAIAPAYFDSLLAKPTDRFSYSEPSATFAQFFVEGRRTGYGYTLVWADALLTTLRVRNVEPASPVARAGLKRGDVVLSIDGHTPREVVAGAPPQVTTAGVPRQFRVRGADGVEREFAVVSAEFPLTIVTDKSIFDITRADGRPAKVGYLAYNSFVAHARPALGAALREFAQAGVTELVLDLRYNGGGSVLESRDLASMIGGARTAQGLYAYLRYNDKQVQNNRSIPFTAEAELLPAPPLAGLSRVIVIASGSTASASELLINGLKPFMPVVLVGNTTYGKPYGFVPRDYCGNTYNAVQFEALNAEGVGGFTSGFAPACTAADDLNRALGDPAEARLRTALAYAATDRCPELGPMARAKALPPERAIGEAAPPGMFAR